MSPGVRQKLDYGTAGPREDFYIWLDSKRLSDMGKGPYYRVT